MTAGAAGDEAPPRRARWWLPEALPAFGPKAMRIYVAVWSALLAAAILVSGLAAYQAMEPHRNPNWSALGITVEDGTREPVVSAVDGREARVRGVRPGDAVLAVDGRPASSGIGAAAQAGRWVLGSDGTGRRLTLRTGADAPRDVTLTRDREAREQRWREAGITSFAYHVLWSALGLAGAMLLIACAVLLFRQRRQPVAALLAFAFLAIPAANGMLSAGWPALSLLGTIVSSLGWPAFLLAVMTMPDGRFALRWTRWLTATLLVFTASEFVVIASGGAWATPAWLASLLIVTFIVGAVAAMGLRYRKLPQGPERQQLRWVFLGFATGAALLTVALSVWLIAPALADGDARWGIWRQIVTQLFFTLAISAFALGLLVSLLRYRLYDADAVIGRSAGYAVLTLMLAAAFGVTAKLVETFFATSFARDAGALPGAVGAGLVLALIAPLHRRIHDWAERRFQKDITRLRRDLPPAVEDLRETATLDELLDEALGRVMRGTRATRAAVMIDGALAARRGEAGEAWPTEMPLRIAHQELGVGTLLVGPRPDGTPVGKDEREALATIADPLARAIRIVRTRETRIGRNEARLAAIEARLAPAPAV